jgi:hypothetical protein
MRIDPAVVAVSTDVPSGRAVPSPAGVQPFPKPSPHDTQLAFG